MLSKIRSKPWSDWLEASVKESSVDSMLKRVPYGVPMEEESQILHGF